MQVTVKVAKARLAELVRRAEEGEEIVLTRHGHEMVRLVAIKRTTSIPERRAVIARVRDAAARKGRSSAPAARSQDVLYDDEGLPS